MGETGAGEEDEEEGVCSSETCDELTAIPISLSLCAAWHEETEK